MYKRQGLCYASDSYAQKTLISIDVHNQRVEDILKEIEEQSDFDFFFIQFGIDIIQGKDAQMLFAYIDFRHTDG